MADYVLIHGTTQSPAGWDRLARRLRERGHRAHAVDLPLDRPELLAEDYAWLIREQVPSDLRRPILVAHSGSGVLLPAAARAVGAARLVWLAAAVPDVHGRRSLAEEITAGAGAVVNQEWIGQNPVDDPVLAAYFLFHDCDLATLRWALTTLRLFFPEAATREVHGRAAWPPAPSTYILPVEDRTLRPDWMRRAARTRLGVEPIEIAGGHCPHVSRPGQVAEILERLAHRSV